MFRKSASRFRIERALVGVVACLLLSARSVPAQQEQTLKGEITESWCAGPEGHKLRMQNGESAEHCAMVCLKRGAKYVLYNPEDKKVYKLDNQKTPQAFFGQNVFVTGTLDQSTGTIHVLSVNVGLSPQSTAQAVTPVASKVATKTAPPAATRTKSIYVLRDSCPKGMATVGKAASEELASWGRFRVVSDPKQADLIFLFSANPYLGDYGTRGGPDPRPGRIDITFLNVIDARTGTSLWTDNRKWGRVLVAKATKDLIVEFRHEFEAGKVRLTS